MRIAAPRSGKVRHSKPRRQAPNSSAAAAADTDTSSHLTFVYTESNAIISDQLNTHYRVFVYWIAACMHTVNEVVLNSPTPCSDVYI